MKPKVPDGVTHIIDDLGRKLEIVEGQIEIGAHLVASFLERGCEYVVHPSAPAVAAVSEPVVAAEPTVVADEDAPAVAEAAPSVEAAPTEQPAQ